jgi:hypothetical protein
MTSWLSQNQEISVGRALSARLNKRRPGTAALPEYGPWKNFSKQKDLLKIRP